MFGFFFELMGKVYSHVLALTITWPYICWYNFWLLNL